MRSHNQQGDGKDKAVAHAPSLIQGQYRSAWANAPYESASMVICKALANQWLAQGQGHGLMDA